MTRRLLLLSNSRDPEGRYLVHPREALAEHLAGVTRAVFVPFAGVGIEWDDYTRLVRDAFQPLGVRVESVHESDDPRSLVAGAEAIAVGGGNTFHLLTLLHRTGLVDAIRARVSQGTPYVGWSAGSVVACPTLGTTNDMPIIEPASFEALALVHFQINAHFTDAHPPGFQGETRRQRLAEYVAVNATMPVIGLPEGSWLRVRGSSVMLDGPHGAPVFRAGHETLDVRAGDELAPLLEARAQG